MINSTIITVSEVAANYEGIPMLSPINAYDLVSDIHEVSEKLLKGYKKDCAYDAFALGKLPIGETCFWFARENGSFMHLEEELIIYVAEHHYADSRVTPIYSFYRVDEGHFIVKIVKE